MTIKLLNLLILITSVSFAQDSREKIAVIDTGIDYSAVVNGKKILSYLCNQPVTDLTSTGIHDNHGHGTNIAAIIAQKMNVKKQCLLIIKWYNTGDEFPKCKFSETTIVPNCSERDEYIKNITIREIDIAISNKVSYINMSVSSNAFIQEEKDILKKAVDLGIKIAVAAGNLNHNFSDNCQDYPACYDIKSDNFKVIGSCKGVKYTSYSNFNGPVKYCRDGDNVTGAGITMTGTSQATAVFMADWISGIIK